MDCVAVGTTNGDIAGLGILLAFAIQAFFSLILSFASFYLRDNLEIDPTTNEVKRQHYQKIRRHIDGVLASVSDAQTLSGIALLLAGLIQRETLELYHFHIIYDTVNFTAVSFCAAILCSFAHQEERKISRFLSIFIFSVLYLAYIIVFGLSLSRWDWETPGSCYNTSRTALPNASHPYVDTIYLSITAFYMYSILMCSLMFFADIRDAPGQRALAWIFRFYRRGIISLAMLQYPLHLYGVFALRSANQDLLTGDSENTWGFGQIVALVMVGQVLVESCEGFRDYYKDLKQEREQAAPAADEENKERTDPSEHAI